MKRVVVTGLGAVTPVGNDVPTMWDHLLKGVSGVGPITLFDAAQYPSRIAAEVKEFDPTQYQSPKEIRRTERFVRLAIASAKQAQVDATLDLTLEDTFRVGVVIGSGMGGLRLIEDQQTLLLEKGPNKISPFMIPMIITNMAPGHVAINLGVKGPNFCTTSACASGAHGVGEAFRMIQRGETDLMFAGGTENCITPLAIGGFCSLMALSRHNEEPTKASRPFDKNRDGFVMGEGAGIMVLEELEHAKKRGARIYAEMVGYGRTADAYHMTAPDMEGVGAAKAMAMALEEAGVKPAQVSYINAHGTSTELNDKIETLAIKQVFGEAAKKTPISSTKSMMGHLIGGAGAVEAVICCLAVAHDAIPPTINYETPDPDCDLDYVPNTARHLPVDVALSNSLGFGGHNATVVFKKYRA